MNFDLAMAIPFLLPAAIEWAEEQAAAILATGIPLTEAELELARGVGVASPEKIRILEVKSLPLPEDRVLCRAAEQLGLLGYDMVGLTIGHGIYLREGFSSVELLSHELRHVYQYEQAGSIGAFLRKYLQQIAEVGYNDAPYEVDARLHQRETYGKV